MIELHFLKIILAYITFISFFWGASKFFLAQDDGAKKGKLIITTLGLPSTFLNLYFLHKTKDTLDIQNLISSFIYIVAILLFWRSIAIAKNSKLSFAFSKERPSSLINDGPYKYIRHPFYLSYSLAWVAGFIGTLNIILCAIMLIMFFIYFKSAQKEEEIILSSELKNDYSNYKKNTGMFLPKIIK